MNIAAAVKDIAHAVFRTETWERDQLPDWALNSLDELQAEINSGDAQFTRPNFFEQNTIPRQRVTECKAEGRNAYVEARRISKDNGKLPYCEIDLQHHDMPEGLSLEGSRIAKKFYKMICKKTSSG